MDTDAERFAELKRIVKEIVPNADSMDMQMADQETGRGFWVTDVFTVKNDRTSTVDQPLIDKINDVASPVLSELLWDASVGENKRGWATVDLSA